MASAELLELVLVGLEGFMGIKIDLHLNMNVAGCMVDEKTSTAEHVVALCPSSRRCKSSSCAAHKMVHRHTLAWMKIVCFQDVRSVTDDR